jgi:hypothetical protein
MWRKHCIFPLKTLWITTNHFVQSLSFDYQHNFFFPSWNIGSIILLVSITYLALVYNYNTIKYICFINPWPHGECISLLIKTARCNIIIARRLPRNLINPPRKINQEIACKEGEGQKCESKLNEDPDHLKPSQVWKQTQRRPEMRICLLAAARVSW